MSFLNTLQEQDAANYLFVNSDFVNARTKTQRFSRKNSKPSNMSLAEYYEKIYNYNCQKSPTLY
jgi:hypothetical protein